MSAGMYILLAAWLFAVGACVGSFLNVLIYRLPLGMNIAYPGSRCPRCRAAIAGRDNIPVISWLALKGRCRHCQATISPRYPLIEAMMGLLFLLLAVAEVFSRGANLPRGEATQYYFGLSPHLWGMYSLHLGLLCLLIAAAGMAVDRARMPWRVALAAIGVALAATTLWPGLRPVAAAPLAMAPVWQLRLGEGLVGALVGGLLGGCTFAIEPKHRPSGVWEDAFGWLPPGVWQLALCGAVLGWQSAPLLGLGAAALFLVVSVVSPPGKGRGLHSWPACLALCIVVFLLVWGKLDNWQPWLVRAADWPLIAASGAGMLTFSLAAGAVRRSGAAPAIEIEEESAPLAPPSYDPSATERRPTTDEGEGLAPSFAVGTPVGQAAQMDPGARERLEAILSSPSYRLAQLDRDFLQRDELRPVRLQLELLKTELAFRDATVKSTIVAFGGTQIVEQPLAQQRLAEAEAALAQKPDDPLLAREVERRRRLLEKSSYYDQARQFARLAASEGQLEGHGEFVIVTGGGPGLMEAANRGAFDAGEKSAGLNIVLPAEQAPNPYITPELCFQFHYFALRKMHFLMRAKALIVFPGGYGTIDELFDALTLRQTRRMQAIPIILFGRAYWEKVIGFQFLADEGVIADEHLNLFRYADTPEEAWRIIVEFHTFPSVHS